MRRANAKKIIERYFHLLTVGCGNSNCRNKHCFSSGEVQNMNPNQAAIKSMELFALEEVVHNDENSCPKTVTESKEIDTPSGSSVNLANTYDVVTLPRRLAGPCIPFEKILTIFMLIFVAQQILKYFTV